MLNEWISKEEKINQVKDIQLCMPEIAYLIEQQ